MSSEAITRNDLRAVLDEVLPQDTKVDMTIPLLTLNTTAVSGNDYEIYTALVSLGWDSEVIV